MTAEEKREYAFSATVSGSFATLKDELLMLQPPFVVRNESDFEWRSSGMDVNLRWDGTEYLGTGYITGTRTDVLERVEKLAHALNRVGVKCRIEVDDEGADERVFTYGQFT